MIISYKMQNSMNQKLVKPFFYSDARFDPFPFGCFNRYHHISKDAALYGITIRHREGNYICRTFPLEILFIQFSDFIIIDNQDG